MEQPLGACGRVEEEQLAPASAARIATRNASFALKHQKTAVPEGSQSHHSVIIVTTRRDRLWGIQTVWVLMLRLETEGEGLHPQSQRLIAPKRTLRNRPKKPGERVVGQCFESAVCLDVVNVQTARHLQLISGERPIKPMLQYALVGRSTHKR